MFYICVTFYVSLIWYKQLVDFQKDQRDFRHLEIVDISSPNQY